MKNVIVSHNELQLNMFLAVTYGLQNHDFGPNLFLVNDITEREYVWKVMKSEKREGSAFGQPVFYGYINKGDFQMNDLRMGVTVCYIRDEAEKFLNNFREYQKANYVPKNQEEADTVSRIAGETGPAKPDADYAFSPFKNWHKPEEIPVNGTEYESEQVLIDVNGNRNQFAIGYYDKKDKDWVVYHSTEYLELEHMKWTYLPIQRKPA